MKTVKVKKLDKQLHTRRKKEKRNNLNTFSESVEKLKTGIAERRLIDLHNTSSASQERSITAAWRVMLGKVLNKLFQNLSSQNTKQHAAIGEGNSGDSPLSVKLGATNSGSLGKGAKRNVNNGEVYFGITTRTTR